MSSVGYPDYQRITQWLGAPIVQGTGTAIGAGTHVDGPIEVANYASVILAIKPTGGPVTVTLKQTVPGGPASLLLTESVVVPAGATLFEAFVLFGQAVELDITGTIAGTTVDYALYGSNTTTNAQVITQATINVQHNDVLVAAEPTLDLEDFGANVWSVVDDGPNTRVKITPPRCITGEVSGAGAIIAGSGFTVSRTGVGRYVITFSPAFSAAPCVVATAIATSGNETLTLNQPTPTQVQVNINSGGAPEDTAFEFYVFTMA